MGLPFHIPALLLGCALGDIGWTTYYLLGGERKYPVVSPLAYYVCKRLDERKLRIKDIAEDTADIGDITKYDARKI